MWKNKERQLVPAGEKRGRLPRGDGDTLNLGTIRVAGIGDGGKGR